MQDYQESRKNYVRVTPGLRAILDGVLLSDASIACGKGKRSAFLFMWQHPSREGWLRELQTEFRAQGVESKLDVRVQKSAYIGSRQLPGGTYLVLRTLSYVEFVAEYARWYSTGKKEVPDDLGLTSTAVRHWFCGDGRGGDLKGTLGFCTDGFSTVSVGRLVSGLRDIFGVESLLVLNDRGHPQILVSKRDEACRLLSIMGDLPPCCVYKVQHVRPAPTTGRGRRLDAGVKARILADRGTGTIRAAAEKYGVSSSKVWALWRQ